MPLGFIGYLLFSLIAMGYGNHCGEEKVNEKNEVYYRFITAFVVLLFLVFLEAMVKTTVTILNDHNALEIGFIGYVIWAILAFLPLRLLLLLRPPFSRVEFIIFFISTGVFFYRIVVAA